MNGDVSSTEALLGGGILLVGGFLLVLLNIGLIWVALRLGKITNRGMEPLLWSYIGGLVIGGLPVFLIWCLVRRKEIQQGLQARKDAIRDGVLVEHVNLETKPMMGNERLQAAEVAERRGDSDEAMRLVKELLEAEPKLASAWRLKSRIHWRLGELAEAELATQQADALRGTA